MSTVLQETAPVQAAVPAFCGACIHLCKCQAEQAGLTCAVERRGPCRQGDHLYRPETRFSGAYAVQAGMAKTVRRDSQGHEQVLAFHLPGELFGLDARGQRQHTNAAVALGHTWFCHFPETKLSKLEDDNEEIRKQLGRMTRRLRQSYRVRSAEGRADQRLAAFIVDLCDRRVAVGLRGDRLPMLMSRIDIASFLDMAVETISRLLGKLQKQGLIKVGPNQLDIIDAAGLRELAAPLLGNL
ncbi:Crp/Fnr family transcriptional regulator [Frateuria aurantia]